MKQFSTHLLPIGNKNLQNREPQEDESPKQSLNVNQITSLNPTPNDRDMP